MFLHIGEGLLVKKTDIITILDARKMMSDEKNQLFFEGLMGEKTNVPGQVKSFILVEDGKDQASTMLLMSGITSTTLQKRFHGNINEMMEIEAREIDGKQTKQL